MKRHIKTLITTLYSHNCRQQNPSQSQSSFRRVHDWLKAAGWLLDSVTAAAIAPGHHTVSTLWNCRPVDVTSAPCKQIAMCFFSWARLMVNGENS